MLQHNITDSDEGNRLTKTKISTGEKEEYTWDHRNRLTKRQGKGMRPIMAIPADRTLDNTSSSIPQEVMRTQHLPDDPGTTR